jgi:predicted RNA methylase
MVQENYWGGSDMMYQCLIDENRVQAFKEAIFASVKPNDIVVDLGAGSGVMGLFALAAGAKRVYLVERDPIILDCLRKTVQGNVDRLVIIDEDATNVVLPERVDIVICEMIATGLLDELQIPAIANIKKYCKPTTNFIPSGIVNHVELVQISNNFYGNELMVIQYEYPWAAKRPCALLCEKKDYFSVTFEDSLPNAINSTIAIRVSKDGIINALRVSNTTFLPGGSLLGSSAAYCMPLIYPIEEIDVIKNDQLILRLEYPLCKGIKNLKYSLVKTPSIMDIGRVAPVNISDVHNPV